MIIAIILNILVPFLSLLGGIIFWVGFFNGLEWIHLISVFLCYLFAVVPTTMFAEHVKYKYEIPNRDKTIIFNNKKFKKGSFISNEIFPTKGIIAGIIIAVLVVVPYIIWFLIFEFIPTIYRYFFL